MKRLFIVACLIAACATPTPIYVSPTFKTKFFAGDEVIKQNWTPEVSAAVEHEMAVCFKDWITICPALSATLTQLWTLPEVKVRWFQTKEAAKAAGYNYAGQFHSFSSITLVLIGDENTAMRVSRLICHEMGHGSIRALVGACDHELMSVLKYSY